MDVLEKDFEIPFSNTNQDEECQVPDTDTKTEIKLLTRCF